MSYVAAPEAAGVTGAVVAVDVLRAFTTAAFAFAAGAGAIVLAEGVEEALEYKRAHPEALAVGEDHGRRPAGFDLPNSPAMVGRADLVGREIVLRTSAGTRGALAARRAERLWCASLVVASATAKAVGASGLGTPTYVLTGVGTDDRLTAEAIERARLGADLSAEAAVVRTALLDSEEAAITRALGAGHVDPTDIECAAEVDRFDFAMEAVWSGGRLRLQKVHPG